MAKALRLESLRIAVSNPAPSFVMLAILLITIVTVMAQAHDETFNRIAIGCVAACVMRVVTLIIIRHATRAPHLNGEELSIIEIINIGSSLLFSLVLGILGASVIALDNAELHALALTMLVGYSSGISVTLELTPKTAVTNILLATCPAAVLALGRSTMTHMAIGVIMLLLISGSYFIIKYRTQYTRDAISQRNAYRDLSRRDPLTGLPNRSELNHQFDRALANPEPQVIAAHYVDLNNFKQVNDTYGHDVGDQLLKEVATRLQRAVGPENIIARLGGDEFVALQFDVKSEQDSDAMRHRLRLEMLPHFLLRGVDLSVSASIGSSMANIDEVTLTELLRRADSEQYQEKRVHSILDSLPCLYG